VEEERADGILRGMGEEMEVEESMGEDMGEEGGVHPVSTPCY
jgi:hypothetical protein